MRWELLTRRRRRRRWHSGKKREEGGHYSASFPSWLDRSLTRAEEAEAELEGGEAVGIPYLQDTETRAQEVVPYLSPP